MKTKEIVINYHITSKCNFKCRYCYASWEDMKNQRKELYSDESAVKKLLVSVFRYFQSLGYNQIRLTIAGGEPLTVNSLPKIIHIAKEIGFTVSIITNGYLL